MVGQELVIPGNGAVVFGTARAVRARDRCWPIILVGDEPCGAELLSGHTAAAEGPRLGLHWTRETQA